MADYCNLDVWKSARQLASDAYRFTEDFPARERYGLTSQIQRAAVSVAANIAEGAGRGHDRDFARFVRIAIGSLNELDTLILIASDVLGREAGESFQARARDLSVRLRNLANRLDGSDRTT